MLGLHSSGDMALPSIVQQWIASLVPRDWQYRFANLVSNTTPSTYQVKYWQQASILVRHRAVVGLGNGR